MSQDHRPTNSNDVDPFGSQPLFSADGKPLGSDGNYLLHRETQLPRARSFSRTRQRGTLPKKEDHYADLSKNTKSSSWATDYDTLVDTSSSLDARLSSSKPGQGQISSRILPQNPHTALQSSYSRYGHNSLHGKEQWEVHRSEARSSNRVDLALFNHQLSRLSTYAEKSDIFSKRAFLSIPLNVAAFVSVELDSNPSALWDLVVLSGSRSNLWAGSIGEYVQARWPDASERIKIIMLALAGSDQHISLEREEVDFLEAKNDIDHEASDSGSEYPPHSHSKDLPATVTQISAARKSLPHDLALWTLKRELIGDLSVSCMSSSNHGSHESILSIVGEVDHQLELIEALAWLFAVLHNGSHGPFPCTVNLNVPVVSAERTTYIIESAHQPDFPSRDSSCWLPLLPRTACAANFDTPFWRPHQMRGIELTFELMCFLCGISYETKHKGGLVLYGERAFVFPVFMSEGCVQWHFQPCEPGDSPHAGLQEDRLKNLDLTDLCNSTRHFLGLWTDPEILLGTESLSYHKLAYSRAKELQSTRVKDSVTVGGSISLPRLISFTGSVTYKVAKTRVTPFLKGPVTDQLYSKVDAPVLLYSPSEKRAWLVSYVSVVLHLARYRALSRAELNYHMPACQRKANGGRAAWKCIKSCYQECIKQPEENEALTEYEKTVKIADHVEEVMACIECTRRETSLARGFFRDRILGYELAAIAKYKDSTVMKKCDLDALTDGWGPLLETIEVVFFYEGMEAPIAPSMASKEAWTRAGACGKAMWQEIPRGLNLLAASLPCLLYLAEQQGERNDGTIKRLTSSHTWHCPNKNGLYTPCKEKTTCSCNHLQQLVPSHRKHTSCPRIKFRKPPAGAVVFAYSEKTTMTSARESMTRWANKSASPKIGHIRNDSGYSSERPRDMEGGNPLPLLEDLAVVSESDSDISSGVIEETASAVDDEPEERPGERLAPTDPKVRSPIPLTQPSSTRQTMTSKKSTLSGNKRNRTPVPDKSQVDAQDEGDGQTSSVPVDKKTQSSAKKPLVKRKSSLRDDKRILSSDRSIHSTSSGSIARWLAGQKRR